MPVVFAIEPVSVVAAAAGLAFGVLAAAAFLFCPAKADVAANANTIAPISTSFFILFLQL